MHLHYSKINVNPVLADIDECEEAARNELSICTENSNCINVAGSHNCVCFEGYMLVNDSCERKLLYNKQLRLHCKHCQG